VEEALGRMTNLAVVEIKDNFHLNWVPTNEQFAQMANFPAGGKSYLHSSICMCPTFFQALFVKWGRTRVPL
jgi:hypothetical protein